jgi:hypothetical protein
MTEEGPRLPNAERALIPERKIRGYLLNLQHKDGHAKAVRFRALAFAPEEWREFERALREQHLTQPASPAGENAFGVKYAITAQLKGPAGDVATIRFIWIIRNDEDFPTLITAYPVRNE